MKILKEIEESLLRKLDYERTGIILRGIMKFYFNINTYNEKNLPDTSSVIALNHATLLDGGIVSSVLSTMKKKAHFWIQYEDVYEERPDLLRRIEQIPVKVENKISNFRYFFNTTLKMSLDYLHNTNDYIGIFPQGPMSKKNNKDEVHSGIVYLIKKYKRVYNKEKPVIPIGLYVKDKDKDIINKYGGMKEIKIRSFLIENIYKKMDYYINIGEPLYLSDLEGDKKEKSEIIISKCKELSDEIKDKIK